MYYILIVVIIAFDQLIKKIVVSQMNLHETIPIFQNIFHITYIQNRGAAFSLLEGYSAVLILFPAVVIIAAFIFMVVKGKTLHKLLAISISFVIAGGAGNLIDRVLLGYVVDYFDFRVFPIFNIADIFVCIGCGLLIIYVLFVDGKKDCVS